jgi:cytoskeleton protein RodZ
MTDKTNSKDQTPANEPKPISERSAGKVLAEARKSQSKTIEDVSASLNLSAGQVRAIELDQSEGLPEETYIRGYIRSYAKLLGINPDDVLQVYAQNNGEGYPVSLGTMPTEMSRKEAGDRSSLLSFYNIGIALVVAICIGFLMYSEMIPNPFAASSTQSEQPSELIQDNSVEEGQALDFQGLDSEANEVGSQTDPDADTEEQEQGSNELSNDTAGEATATAATNPDENTIRLTFTQSSWLDVRDESNEKLAYQSYDRGDILELKSVGKMHVFIGNADGVEVQVNGEEFDVEAHREGVYAKFSIEP